MDTIEIYDVNKGTVFISTKHIVAIEPRHEKQDKHRCGSFIRVVGLPHDDYESAKDPHDIVALIEAKTSGHQYTMELGEAQRKMFE